MLDWDNLRFFLTVARKGSLRSSAAELGVNHGTVNRRIAAVEQQLETKLFERLPTGYVLTSAGEEIFLSAEHVEEKVNALRREAFVQDEELSGELRFTIPEPMVSHLLMPDLARFAKQHPNIDLQIVSSYEELNLTKREADVALRITNLLPPGHLFGRKLITYCASAYASKNNVEKLKQSDIQEKMAWIVNDEDARLPRWAEETGYSTKNRHYRFNDLNIRLGAVKADMGACILPCLIGDVDPSLERIPPAKAHPFRDIWILTHRDLRNTPRVRIFVDFITQAFLHHKDLIEGKGSAL